ncbi:MAG: hypothetical protein CL582_23120 [Alteromonadaceae bacterium]|nr:hypothetical protein [Alteromonadaceae bacterium]
MGRRAFGPFFLFNGQSCPTLKEIDMRCIALALLVLSGCATVPTFPKLTSFSRERLKECRAVGSQEGIYYPPVVGKSFRAKIWRGMLPSGYECMCSYSLPTGVSDPGREKMMYACTPAEGLQRETVVE